MWPPGQKHTPQAQKTPRKACGAPNLHTRAQKGREGTAVLEKASLKHEMLKKAVVIVTKQEKNIFLSITNLFLPHISPENYRKL